MIGLVTKDFMVFRKCFSPLYRIISAAVLAGTVILYSAEGIHYIALMLPALGVAFLTEIIKVEEKSDWKNYLPALPITSREIVLSRYVFCGVLLVALAGLTFTLCAIAGVLGGIVLKAIIAEYVFGIWFAILMVCFGIPVGYFFKNELCTGALMGSCLVIAIIRSIGADTFFFNLASPTAWIILVIMTAAMVFASYYIALWVYLTKRYEKVNANASKNS